MATQKKESARRKRKIFRRISTKYDTNWRSFKFWRNAFILFWIFSFLGHILELAWGALPMLFGQPMTEFAANLPIFTVAEPYGFGALALIWLVYPFVVRDKLNIFWTYFLSVLVTTAIEFICAAVIVLLLGHNPFWDYSNQPFNLFGFVYLRNSLAFGFAGALMLYYVFPAVNNLLNKVKAQQLNVFFWILFVSYLLTQVWQIFK